MAQDPKTVSEASPVDENGSQTEQSAAVRQQQFLVRMPLVINRGDGTPTLLTMVLPPVGRTVPFGEEVTVYADEQGVSSPRKSDEFAIGLEFGPTPMPEEIVREALTARSCAVGCPKRDFFHARVDCDACKAVLAEAIRTKLKDRFFISFRWRHSDAQEGHPKGTNLHQHALALALGFVSSIANVRRIVVKFERIAGLSTESLSRWFRRDVEIRADVMVKYGIPLSIAPIDFEPVSKEEPGVQVCDHLLWAERRVVEAVREGEGDSASWERTGLVFNHAQEDGPYSINFYRPPDAAFPCHFRRPEPRDPGDRPWEQVASMLYVIEATIHDLARSKPHDLRHLDRLISTASSRTRGRPRLNDDAWQSIHRAFLSLVGIYINQPDLTDEQRQAAADAAELSRIITDGRDTRSCTMSDAWLAIRARLVDAGDPKLT